MHKKAMKILRKFSLLTWMLPLAFELAMAAGLDDSVARCQVIEDRATRLQCFDELPGRATTPEAAPSAKATPQRSQSQPPQAQQVSQFKQAPATSAHDTAPRDDDFPRTLEITRISKTIDDRHIFYMSDGSVWQEFRNGPKRFKANSAATIERSSGKLLASYWMKIDGTKFQVISLK